MLVLHSRQTWPPTKSCGSITTPGLVEVFIWLASFSLADCERGALSFIAFSYLKCLAGSMARCSASVYKLTCNIWMGSQGYMGGWLQRGGSPPPAEAGLKVAGTPSLPPGWLARLMSRRTCHSTGPLGAFNAGPTSVGSQSLIHSTQSLGKCTFTGHKVQNSGFRSIQVACWHTLSYSPFLSCFLQVMAVGERKAEVIRREVHSSCAGKLYTEIASSYPTGQCPSAIKLLLHMPHSESAAPHL